MNIIINAINEVTLKSALTRINLGFALWKKLGNEIPKIKITVVDSGRADKTKALAEAYSRYMPIQYLYFPTEGYVDSCYSLWIVKDILIEAKVLYLQSNVFLSERAIGRVIQDEQRCGTLHDSSVNPFSMKFDSVEFEDLPKDNKRLSHSKLFLISNGDIENYIDGNYFECLEEHSELEGIEGEKLDYLNLKPGEKIENYIVDFTK